MSISITFKQSAQENFELSFEKSTSITEIKKAAAERVGAQADGLRLIYKGKILKDSDTLDSIRAEDGHTFHVVKSAGSKATPTPATTTSANTPAAAPNPTPAAAVNPTPSTAPPPPQSVAFPGAAGGAAAMNNPATAGGLDPMAMMAGMGGGMGAGRGMNPEMMSQMMSNPMVQQMMQNLSANPELLQTMMRSNPMIQQMMQSNPQVAAMMQNPEMLRLLFNPQFMQSMMQMQQAMTGAGMGMGAPGGAGPVGAAGAAATPPAAGQPGPSGGAAAGQPDFAAMMNNMSANPMFQAMAGGMGLPGAGGGGDLNAPIPENDRANLESQYSAQLEQLQGMGFVDREANLNALRMTGGNVEHAINLLFDIGGGN